MALALAAVATCGLVVLRGCEPHSAAAAALPERPSQQSVVVWNAVTASVHHPLDDSVLLLGGIWRLSPRMCSLGCVVVGKQ